VTEKDNKILGKRASTTNLGCLFMAKLARGLMATPKELNIYRDSMVGKDVNLVTMRTIEVFSDKIEEEVVELIFGRLDI